MLDNDSKRKLTLHVEKLIGIYENINTTEYMVYEWVQGFSKFVQEVKSANPKITGNFLLNIGGDIIEYEEQLAHTPSSFGLWQINVDFFIERITQR